MSHKIRWQIIGNTEVLKCILRNHWCGIIFDDATGVVDLVENVGRDRVFELTKTGTK